MKKSEVENLIEKVVNLQWELFDTDLCETIENDLGYDDFSGFVSNFTDIVLMLEKYKDSIDD